jgi:hypothetical protein
MKIPKAWYKFRVGDIVCKVSRKNQRPIINGRVAGGYYDTESHEIWIDPSNDNELGRFFHEFMHAAFDDMAVHQMPGWNDDIEELFCEKIARYLTNLHMGQK